MKRGVWLVGLLALVGCNLYDGHRKGEVKIEGGSYIRGDETGYNDESLQEIKIDSFYLCKYEVTQAQYQALMGNNPSFFKGKNLPVEQVNFYSAINYANALSRKEGFQVAYSFDGHKVVWDKTANGYRLPTEAEWEYACRAGTTTAYNTGDTIEISQANFKTAGYIGSTVKVGSYKPNHWGLYGMHGNVAEWVWDYYDADYYKYSPTDNPSGPLDGMTHIFRGGGWNDNATALRSAFRLNIEPGYARNYIGFRLARSIIQPKS